MKGAALAGARTLNGMSSINYNATAAIAMAQTVAQANSILGTNITLAQVGTPLAGIYQYSSSAGRFQAVFNQFLDPSVDVMLCNAYLNWVDATWH